jgi:endonuclease-3 related protein
VADANVKKLLCQIGLVSYLVSYEELQSLLMDNLPHDLKLFQKFHLLIVRHATELCLSWEPLCSGCPLLDICEYGQREPITPEQADAFFATLFED